MLGRANYASRQALDLFHYLRKAGNDAVHGDLDDFAADLAGLKMARELGAWFVRSYGGTPKLALGPFVPPPAPADPTASLRVELDQLRAEVEGHRSAAEIAQARAEALALDNLEAAERLRQEAEERQVWQKLAEDAGAAGEVRAALEATQRQAEKAAPAELAKLEKAAEAADNAINLDEAATRAIIDQQLPNAGWEADTRELRYAKGARPTKGRDLAIAEWPTASGPADCALFAGLTLVGVVEAKRRNRNVMSVLPQTERYAAGIDPGAHLHGRGPWGEFKAPLPSRPRADPTSSSWRPLPASGVGTCGGRPMRGGVDLYPPPQHGGGCYGERQEGHPGLSGRKGSIREVRDFISVT